MTSPERGVLPQLLGSADLPGCRHADADADFKEKEVKKGRKKAFGLQGTLILVPQRPHFHAGIPTVQSNRWGQVLCWTPTSPVLLGSLTGEKMSQASLDPFRCGVCIVGPASRTVVTADTGAWGEGRALCSQARLTPASLHVHNNPRRGPSGNRVAYHCWTSGGSNGDRIPKQTHPVVRGTVA